MRGIWPFLPLAIRVWIYKYLVGIEDFRKQVWRSETTYFKRRMLPPDFNKLPASEQWEWERRLGLLDE